MKRACTLLHLRYFYAQGMCCIPSVDDIFMSDIFVVHFSEKQSLMIVAFLHVRVNIDG